MSDDSGIAVESPPAVEVPPIPKQRRKKQPADAKPKQQPPYAVVLFNDEEHTFQYVVETLTKVFGYIATPPGNHWEYALRVAAAGKPAYVEKPMARNHAECQRMVEAFAQVSKRVKFEFTVDVPLTFGTTLHR